MAIISLIAAIGENNELGKDNDLLWHISEDLKRFKKITSGHTVVMGRKTFESIKSKPLPNRKNIVITGKADFPGNGALIVTSIDAVFHHIDPAEEVFILGGASIYNQFLPDADYLYLTHVHERYKADVFFPDFDKNQWEIIEEIHIDNDKQAEVPYSFITYKRK